MLNLCFPERSVSRHGGIRVTTSIKLNEAEKKQTQAGPVPLGLTTVYSILATTFCPTQLNFFLAVASSCCFFPSKYEGIMLFKRSVSVKPRKRLPRAVEIIAFRYRLWDPVTRMTYKKLPFAPTSLIGYDNFWQIATIAI